MRPVKVTTDYLMTAEGSVLIEVGNTRVLCAAVLACARRLGNRSRWPRQQRNLV